MKFIRLAPLCAVLAGVAIGLGAPSLAGAETPKYGGYLKYVVPAEPPSYDGFIAKVLGL